MIKMLILTHGMFATGINQTMSLFLGDLNPFDSIGAYLDDKDIDEQIDEYLSTINVSDELLVLTDIMGGSVCQKIIKYLGQKKIFIVAGVNLPMLMQASSLSSKDKIATEDINMLISAGKQGVIFVNEELQNQSEFDDDE